MDYALGDKVGSGSFGDVYEARDSSGNRCAVKLVRSGGVGGGEHGQESSEDVSAGLLRSQYRLLSSLSHRRIVKALDFDNQSPSGPILVTELIDGVDLRTHVETSGPGDLVLIAAQVLDGLRYLHGLGEVHGDLKPDSILVSERGGTVEVTLIDAGFDYGKGSNLPTLVGTLPYLAPEVTRDMPGDVRSDLYSLGVVLYEVLTGQCPFRGSSDEETLEKHLALVPEDPSSVNPEVAASWDELIGTLLKKEPFMRYKDAVSAGLELERLFGPSGVFLDNIVPPDSAVLVDREEEARWLEERLLPSTGKGVIIQGRRGCGAGRMLHEIECVARLRGYKVHRISLEEELPAFAQIVDAVTRGARAEPEVPVALESGSSRSEADCFDALLGAVYSSLSPGRRCLFTIDRGEVMDSRELRLLGAIAARLSDVISVVVACQTDGAPHGELPGHEVYETIRLDPLGRDALEALLKSYFSVSAVPQDLLEALYNVSEGNPGFVSMMLKHLWSTGSVRIKVKGGVLEIVWDKTMGIPATIGDVVRERVRGLSGQALEVLKFICAGAGQIETTILAAVTPAGTLDRVLGQLVRNGLVEVSEDKTSVGLKWKNLAEVVRESFPAEALRDASLALASIVEARPPKGCDYFRLGALYLDGGECGRAFEYLVRAGDYFTAFSARDAISAYDKALQCGADGGPAAEVKEKLGSLKLARGDLAGAVVHFEGAASSRPSAERKMGWVRALQGETAEAIEILSRCEAAAAETGDAIETAMIRLDLGHVHSVEGHKDVALRLLRQARTVFVEQGMAGEAGSAANRIGIVEMRSANFKSAARAWSDAMGDFERAGDRKTAAVCLMNLGLCHRKQMDFERADDALRQALAVFDELKALYERASCCQNYGILMLDFGRLSEARRLAEEALSVNTLLGRSAATISSAILLSATAIESGNWMEAERRLADLLEADLPLDSYHRAMVTRYIAATNAMSGKCERALELVDESHDLACRADDAEGQGQALLQRSEILLRCNRPKEALRTARKALTVLGLSSSPLLANDAQRVVGEALAMCGDTQAAVVELMQAREGFEGLAGSLHMGRVFRGLALAFRSEGDHGRFAEYNSRAIEVFRDANARYDYARSILLGGQEAADRGNLLQARHYLLEAARIFETLDIGDLHKTAVSEMDRIPSGELETKAVTSLSKISGTLSSSHDLTTVLDLAMDLAIEYLGAERGVLMLEDETTGELATFVERKMDSESLQEVIGISRSIVESVRSSGQSVIASDATKDPRFKDSQSVRMHNVMSVMCVPLTMGSKLMGIIYLDSRGVPSMLSSLERAFVEAFANQVTLAITNARSYGRLQQDVVDLKRHAGERYSFEHIIGPGKKMQEVFRQVDIAAKSTLRVMVVGDTGTGKELVAGLVHKLSERRDAPFVSLDFSTIPRDLIESELFGIEKGVATGVTQRPGVFERAAGGTLFLDEIGDMPLDAQTALLRVLAEHQEFGRVGGGRKLKADVRVISATNKDPRELVKQGRFRDDLYHRLNGMRIQIPRLRDRMEDLAPLVEYFLHTYTEKNSKPGMHLSSEAFDVLTAYLWPGNVRDLQNCIERAVVFAEGTLIGVEHLPPEILESVQTQRAAGRSGSDGLASLPAAVADVERQMVVDALDRTGWVKTKAARQLGIHESTLRKKMKQLGIRRE